MTGRVTTEVEKVDNNACSKRTSLWGVHEDSLPCCVVAGPA